MEPLEATDRGWRRRRWEAGPGASLALGVLVAVLLGVLLLGAIRWLQLWPPRPAPQAVAAAGCPRPQSTGSAPGFGQQEQEIRRLRRQGFRRDFFAQLELGERYEGRRDVDRNISDPEEAAVWYALALTNPDGYAAVVARPQAGQRRRDPAPASLYDECRAAERDRAAEALDRLWARMSSEEQQSVRQRLVYVLYTQGGPGLRTLARVTATGAGPYGQPAGEDLVSPLPVELFARNDVDAYLYSYLAAEAGDVGGYVLLKDLEQGVGPSYADVVEAKANRWAPPYEFYPPDAPESGVPHSDESPLDDDLAEGALLRLSELPFIHIGRALAFLQVTPRPVPSEKLLQPQQVRALQGMLGRAQTGRLTPLERVRAIQYAAVNGSADAQLVLAVMYAEGVGVRTDYARAFAWFERADRQGSAEAKFAIANYFSLGVEGVADQDKAKAVVYRLDSAMAGFKPSADRIRAVLAQVSRHPRRQTGQDPHGL